jgi:RHS repeat-associated protein
MTGTLISAQLANGAMTTTVTSNSQGLLANLKTVKGSTVLRNMDYVFNAATGNLTSRTGMIAQSESFGYDELDRLVSVKHSATEAMSIGYAANGNITAKTGLGTYDYHPAKPHIVQYVDNPNGWIPEDNQTVTYNAFNKAARIQESKGSNIYELNFTYGPDRERWKTELKKNNTLTKTIIFAGDYERIIENGTAKQLYYISGSDGLAAIYVKQSGQPDKIYYVHADHLGSIVSLTDANGSEVFHAGYDAWGKQTISNNILAFHRGYTGHEHLPDFGLINMNGRMYDPILGRFLSADPFVQMPDYSQSFNRYAYCLNNPVNTVDFDGRLVIFINGKHYVDCSSNDYWDENGGGFATAVMNHLNDRNDIYRDGSVGGWKNIHNNRNAIYRRSHGYIQGLFDAVNILSRISDENGNIKETIKIVTHSMGAAYAKGYVKALLQYLKEMNISTDIIEFEADFAPYQPKQQKANPEVKTYQFSHNKDWVAGKDKMEGAEYMDTSSDPNQTHWIQDFWNQVSNLPYGEYRVVHGQIVPY